MIAIRKVLETVRISCCQVVTFEGLNWLESPRYPQIWVTLDHSSHSVVIKLHL
jgi:hypothetical protein